MRISLHLLKIILDKYRKRLYLCGELSSYLTFKTPDRQPDKQRAGKMSNISKKQIVEKAFTHAGQDGSTVFTQIDQSKVSQVADLVYHAYRIDGSLTAGGRFGIVIRPGVELTDEVVERLYDVLDHSEEAQKAAGWAASILSDH